MSLALLVLIIFLGFSSYMFFRAKEHLLYWRICTALLWSGVFCFLAKFQIETTLDTNGFLHEPFALIPLGYLFLFLGVLGGLLRILTDLLIHVRR